MVFPSGDLGDLLLPQRRRDTEAISLAGTKRNRKERPSRKEESRFSLQESAVILSRLVLKRAVEHLTLQKIRLIIMENGRLQVR